MDEPVGAQASGGDDGGAARARPSPQDLIVYWRPGCFYCSDLFHHLEQAGIEAECHNIWEDEDARNFVREHNRGNETVPTVAWQDQVMTNPRPASLIQALRGAGGPPPVF
jgi:glutaredoxin